MPIRIAVDAMGGDHAPDVNIGGALAAIAESPDLSVLLVGQEETILKQLKKRKAAPSERLSILHAEEVISMEDHAGSAMRKKKGSSIHVGLQAVKDGKADAFISAGNSGAVMTAALFVLGRIPGVERPAIVIKFPTANDYIILLDGGANVDCKPSHLFQFAVMGRIYTQVVEGKNHPRIGLLSNGSEEHKGNELTRETHALLKSGNVPDYIGYVEGFDFFRGTADVIVCDGFVGNVSLKLAEGLADTAFQWFRKEIRKDVSSLVGLLLMKKLLKKFKNKFDYEPYGAAPLLGIDGMVLIGHGSSTDVAIKNGILTAKRGVESQLVEKTRGYISKHLSESLAAKPSDTETAVS